jgi:hypothetical protein
MSKLHGIIVLAFLLAATPARAEPEPDPVLLRNGLGFTAAAVACSLGAFGGAIVGFELIDCGYNGGAGGGIPLASYCQGVPFFFGGIALGASAASAGAMWLVGTLLAGQGHFYWALLGSAVGTGMAMLLASSLPSSPLLYGFGLVPAAGALVAYHLSDRDERSWDSPSGPTVSLGLGNLVVRF